MLIATEWPRLRIRAQVYPIAAARLIDVTGPLRLPLENRMILQ